MTCAQAKAKRRQARHDDRYCYKSVDAIAAIRREKEKIARMKAMMERKGSKAKKN